MKRIGNLFQDPGLSLCPDQDPPPDPFLGQAHAFIKPRGATLAT